MGHKIFVSYKYHDTDVYNLSFGSESSVRDYVDKFEELIGGSSHIFKGESDGEDLSDLSEEVIWEKLKNSIYDSTLTIVFISPSMKESIKADKDQWIPWEVSFSLKETSRRDSNGNPIASRTNAMIGVVIPDCNNLYSYYYETMNCCSVHCRRHHTEKLFDIMARNMFNYKKGNKIDCGNGSYWSGKHSFIDTVKWGDFINSMDNYIDEAYKIRDDIDNYEISKEV